MTSSAQFQDPFPTVLNKSAHTTAGIKMIFSRENVRTRVRVNIPLFKNSSFCSLDVIREPNGGPKKAKSLLAPAP